jgi:ferredoxin--NADP+ reductase
MGCEVHSVIGFRNRDLVILEDEFRRVSDKLYITTDDGSYGEKGVITQPLERVLAEGGFDKVIAIGPLVMMKFTVLCAKKFGVPSTVSMNPVMIDGTGMCGGCRLTVGGKMKFACVDGPEFDGEAVDFDEAISRSNMYHDFERHAYEETCNLFAKEVK